MCTHTRRNWKHVRAHTRTHTHTHAHTRTRTHTRTHIHASQIQGPGTHTHTHTHTHKTMNPQPLLSEPTIPAPKFPAEFCCSLPSAVILSSPRSNHQHPSLQQTHDIPSVGSKPYWRQSRRQSSYFQIRSTRVWVRTRERKHGPRHIKGTSPVTGISISL